MSDNLIDVNIDVNIGKCPKLLPETMLIKFYDTNATMPQLI